MPSQSTLALDPAPFDPTTRITTHGSMMVVGGLFYVEKRAIVTRYR